MAVMATDQQTSGGPTTNVSERKEQTQARNSSDGSSSPVDGGFSTEWTEEEEQQRVERRRRIQAAAEENPVTLPPTQQLASDEDDEEESKLNKMLGSCSFIALVLYIRRHQIGSGRLHLLQCASWQGIIIWRLEHYSSMLRGYSYCEFFPFSLRNEKFMITFIFLTGALFNSLAACHLPQGVTCSPHIYHIWFDLLLCYQQTSGSIC